ncbi:PREDICTED: HSPB1-associated protein 1 [Nanorana parkeri]|uniref:HSPB1-associated protein 1 n=1 Tax=Nanorana parkeri TaxID=125878 RepID=UPI0008542DC7|nr:PREDICTED: HSPB1-associated protein 1 [Nanorana parkeri]
MDHRADTGSRMKPFTAQEAREIVLGLDRPAVFLAMAQDWPASRWDAARLSDLLQDKSLCFRIGRRRMDTEPQFETQCDYIEGTVKQFRSWVSGDSPELCGAFRRFDRAEFWAYADYKYLAVLFEDRADILQDVLWEDFGFPGRGGRESTLWVGSRGANTPCHVDSYGCNLVLQVEGRKRWHLFPPEDTDHLYPTRIPYEESSIFSRVNVVNPDWSRCPSFSNAHPHVVTLHPGQVLFVPRHWWHYVESVDDVTVSVNSWIELDSDHESRVEEAITRMVVCVFKSADTSDLPDDWLNPTEGAATSHATNLEYLNQARTAYLQHERAATAGESGGAADDGDAPPLKKRRLDRSSEVIGGHFGQYLLPVFPASGDRNAGGEEDAALRAETQDEGGASPGADTIITSDAVLDCLVNPRVVRLVAQLLLKGPCR